MELLMCVHGDSFDLTNLSTGDTAELTCGALFAMAHTFFNEEECCLGGKQTRRDIVANGTRTLVTFTNQLVAAPRGFARGHYPFEAIRHALVHTAHQLYLDDEMFMVVEHRPGGYVYLYQLDQCMCLCTTEGLPGVIAAALTSADNSEFIVLC